MEPVRLELQDICKNYQQGDTIIHALQHVNLIIEPGEYLSITGQSGSGKSTLMNILGCLDVPTSGSYRIGGQDMGKMTPGELADFRSRTIGFIFQSFCLMPDLNALENVELPLLYQKVPKKERKQRAMEALCRVGLENRMRHRPSQMSGGQQQRTAIARAIYKESPFGSPLNLYINDLFQYNFFSTCSDIIHQPDPLHLIPYLQCFCHTLFFCHLLH